MNAWHQRSQTAIGSSRIARALFDAAADLALNRLFHDGPIVGDGFGVEIQQVLDLELVEPCDCNRDDSFALNLSASKQAYECSRTAFL